MPATSDVEICNLALVRLGQKQLITSLDQNASQAIMCRLHYPRTRDALLSEHTWNFATKYAALSRDASYAGDFEFDYRFQLPTDCLRVVRTAWDANGSVAGAAIYGFPGLVGSVSTVTPYRIVGRYLHTNETDASIEYIAQITDVAQFDDLFVDVLAQRLAAELSPAISDNASQTKNLWEVYQNKLVEARNIDASEGTPREPVDASAWIAARV